MLIKYHGQVYDAVSTVEDGERELDMLEDNVNLEDTMEFPNNFLDNTLELNELLNLNVKKEETND